MSSQESPSPLPSRPNLAGLSLSAACPSLLPIPDPDPSLVTKTILRTLTSDRADAHTNITLVSSDGTHIPALRMLLTTPYFHKLLNSEFAESKLSEVHVSIPPTPLRHLLEFLYTDDCEPLRIMRKKTQMVQDTVPRLGSQVVCCNEISTLMELADAADYSGSDRLFNTCEQTIHAVMHKFPHVASTLLQLLTKRCSTWNKRLSTQILGFLMDHADIALMRSYVGCDLTYGVMHLDESAAEKLFESFKDNHNRGQQTKMFEVLVAWISTGTALKQSSCNPSPQTGSITVDTSKMEIAENRRQFGKRIASSFDFLGFRPSFLSNVVEPSGLLEPKAFSDIYKNISLLYEDVIDVLQDNRATSSRFNINFSL